MVRPGRIHSSHHAVVVVGGGQAGLAIGYFLAKQGRDFVILERANDIAPAWRDRWDSLTLFTPRRFDSLPGIDFPGDPDGYPTRDEVIEYLRSFAAAFDLPIRLGTPVRRLGRDGGTFVLDTDSGRLSADQVVVATGPFQEPCVPRFANQLVDEVVQLHSSRYRNPSDLPAGRTLVIGGGNTGYQIAQELATSRETHLAVGTRQPALPQRLLGRDLFWWLTKTRLIDKPVDSRLGKRFSQKETLVGPMPRLARQLGVISHPRATSVDADTVCFEDGSSVRVDGVVWATGFRYDHSWIDLPIRDASDRVKHTRGVTDVPGLYTLGLQWQYTRGSALLGFIGNDAAFLAQRIAAHAGSAEPTPVSPPAAPQALTAGRGD
jgi:putative flavoprotein involved in K+ transport